MGNYLYKNIRRKHRMQTFRCEYNLKNVKMFTEKKKNAVILML